MISLLFFICTKCGTLHCIIVSLHKLYIACDLLLNLHYALGVIVIIIIFIVILILKYASVITFWLLEKTYLGLKFTNIRISNADNPFYYLEEHFKDFLI